MCVCVFKVYKHDHWKVIGKCVRKLHNFGLESSFRRKPTNFAFKFDCERQYHRPVHNSHKYTFTHPIKRTTKQIVVVSSENYENF